MRGVKLKIRYNDAVRTFNDAHTENDCANARTAFASLGDLFDSKQKVLECDEKAVYIRKDNIYNEAKEWMEHVRYEEDVNKIITLLESISGFKDSFEMIQKCRDRLEEFAEAERKRKTQEKNKKNKIIKTIIGAVVALVLAVVAIVIGKSVSYNNAVEFYEKGNNEEAYELFSKLGRYKDSYTYTLKLCSVGDEISFGKFSWIVYKKTDSTVGLLCGKPLDKRRKYNHEFSDVTWENCDLRKWLNNEFYNEFTNKEKSMITETTCNNKENAEAEYKTTGGNDTKDKVFLLSIDEANKLSKDILECGSRWWLRSPYHDDSVWYVLPDGEFGCSGCRDSGGGVRPALNLKF